MVLEHIDTKRFICPKELVRLSEPQLLDILLVNLGCYLFKVYIARVWGGTVTQPQEKVGSLGLFKACHSWVQDVKVVDVFYDDNHRYLPSKPLLAICEYL